MAAAGPPPSAAAVALPFLVHDVGPEYYEPQAQYGIAGRSLVNAGFVEFDPVDGEPSYGSSYLVESRGELFLVVVIFDGENVHKIAEVTVYQMDFSAPAWCKVDGIGGRVFLLGGDRIGESNFGASCSAGEHGLQGNCIYFLNHYAINENFVHIIDLEKGTEEVQRPFKEFVDPLRPPFWMLRTEEVAEVDDDSAAEFQHSIWSLACNICLAYVGLIL
ncbi:uncharacterized protein LOC112885103 [Panicum hallii]|uniref:uncharacterized protein LOC112885103 n=1 Tax=Panicum hallii TaxID=206008 RepID=UPI000DF4D1F4|nr:uncharacterized protein LOC112885103 [Panicum hallii]